MKQGHAEINSQDITIIITTFEERFFTYAIPLISQIRISSQRPIVLAINGNSTGPADSEGLRDLICSSMRYNSVFPITFTSIQGCSSLWNSGIKSSGTKKYLILNDDISIKSSELDEEIEKISLLLDESPLLTINSSWSHFAISHETILKVGEFDERLLGFGAEDSDYLRRYENITSQVPTNLISESFVSLNSPSRDMGVRSDEKKYSSFNYIYYRMKLEYEHFHSKSAINDRITTPSVAIFRSKFLPLMNTENTDSLSVELAKYWTDPNFDHINS